MKPLGNKDGTFLAVATATRDAKVFHYDSGKSKASIATCYDRFRDQNGDKVSKYIDVEAWGSLVPYASCIEKGDSFLVFGVYERDDYQSKRKGEDVYKVKAEFICVQPTVDASEEAEEPHTAGTFTELPNGDEENPFADKVEESDGELPF